MNLTLPWLLAFLAALIVIGRSRPNYLYFIWALVLLVFPTTRTLVAGAPLYWFDVVTLALLSSLYAYHGFRFWSPHVPKWHWWFIGVGFVFGVLIPVLYYRTAVLEITWTWGHTSLAWMAFLLGFVPYITRRGESYQTALGMGILASIFILATEAALQFGNAEVSVALNKFYFRDHVSGNPVNDLFVKEYFTTRVNGPHGDPNTFGGKAVIMAIACAWLLRRHAKKYMYAGFVGAMVIVLATVSRQCLLAALVGGSIILLFSRSGLRARALFVAGIGAVVASAAGFSGGWSERLGRFEGGVSEDIGWIARLVLGPERLLNAIAEHPTIIITGVGLDVHKLVANGVDVGNLSYGFVSNGFLLPFFFLGISGFLLTLIFWSWVMRAAAGLPRTLRATGLGSVAAMMLLIFADNYSFLNETVVAMLFLVAGVIAGERYGRRGATAIARRARVTQANMSAARRLIPLHEKIRIPYHPGKKHSTSPVSLL